MISILLYSNTLNHSGPLPQNESPLKPIPSPLMGEGEPACRQAGMGVTSSDKGGVN
jgi:hypothetical protein